MNTKYTYRPVRFYVTTISATWGFWFCALIFKEGFICTLTMLLGLLSPAIIALITVFGSKSKELKADFKRKIFRFYKLRPKYIFAAVIIFALIVGCSILLSTFWGQSLNQFSVTEGFSFTGAGVTSAFLTILLASVLEEVGWRGYGEDSIAQYCSWFKESIIFGFVWALWHLPLFFIPGTYHYGIREMNVLYMFNFFISVIPFGFITTWVYVKNNRSILASIIFHLFVNFMQEKIAMTQTTKCVETICVTLAAAIIVFTNKDLFFEKRHIGRILES